MKQPDSRHHVASPARTTDEVRRLFHMKRALELAASCPSKPFGAIIVRSDTDEVVGEGFNRTIEDPILHAEIVAIHDCARQNPNVPWETLELFTTAEPCAMCQCAIAFARISFVYYGTSSAWLKERNWRQIDIRAEEVIRRTPWSKTIVVGGILATECNALFERARQCSGPTTVKSPLSSRTKPRKCS
jgi:tRNA(adenine34) deaminase